MADTLRPNERLISDRNDVRQSNNGRMQLKMQNDGNLVLYDRGNPRWASETAGQDVEFCAMQNDGNLVLYLQGSGRPVWSSDTQGNPGSFLAVQDDGNLVIYKPAHPIWSTGTHD